MKNFKIYVSQNSGPNQSAKLLNTNNVATCQELLSQLKNQKMSSPDSRQDDANCHPVWRQP
jgi:hypothetical protein